MFTTRALALILAASLTAPVLAQTEPATAPSEPHELVLQELVSSQATPLIDAEVVPGLVVGVLQEGRTQYFGFGGINADGSGQAPDERTLYEIGSITKVFTAALLAEMAQRGEVALDDPIVSCYPDDHEAPQLGSEPIRLWHLATHSSGLPRMPTNMPATDPGSLIRLLPSAVKNSFDPFMVAAIITQPLAPPGPPRRQ